MKPDTQGETLNHSKQKDLIWHQGCNRLYLMRKEIKQNDDKRAAKSPNEQTAGNAVKAADELLKCSEMPENKRHTATVGTSERYSC